MKETFRKFVYGHGVKIYVIVGALFLCSQATALHTRARSDAALVLFLFVVWVIIGIITMSTEPPDKE